MPITCVYSHKGGQGVTSIAAATATLITDRHHHTLLIDTGHDAAAVLGEREPSGPGLTDYLADTTITLADITTSVTEGFDLIHVGDEPRLFDTSTYGLVTGGLDHYDHVIIDIAPDAHQWTRHANISVLVTRPCYLALRHATGHTRRPDHVVVVNEPGRTLNFADIAAVTGTPVTAATCYDPIIARAIDAGILATRIPRSLARDLKPLVDAITGTRR